MKKFAITYKMRNIGLRIRAISETSIAYLLGTVTNNRVEVVKICNVFVVKAVADGREGCLASMFDPI
jgi:hypothetical protein